jgi:hypothetical protein
MELIRKNGTFFSGESTLEHRSYTYKSTGATYTGEFNGNLRHGFGTMVWVDGTTYEGRFHYNLASGQGKMIFWTGDVYEGSFRCNMFNGKGAYKKKSGK